MAAGAAVADCVGKAIDSALKFNHKNGRVAARTTSAFRHGEGEAADLKEWVKEKYGRTCSEKTA